MIIPILRWRSRASTSEEEGELADSDDNLPWNDDLQSYNDRLIDSLTEDTFPSNLYF